jgi:ABC-type multidrug transport system fused ATPase/permease subunit
VRLSLLTAAQSVISILDLIAILTLGLLTATSVAVASGQPVRLPSRIETIVGQTQLTTTTVAYIALAAGFMLITRSLLSFILTRASFRFLATQQVTISSQLADDLFSRPLSMVASRSSLRTAQALTLGVDMICYQILGQATIVVAEITLITVLIIGLTLVDPILTLFIVTFFAAIAILLQRILGGWAGRLGRERAALDVESTAYIQRIVHTYREISVLGRRTNVIARFRNQRNDISNSLSDAFVVGQVGKYIFEIALVVGLGFLVAMLTQMSDLPTAIGMLALAVLTSSRLFPSLLRVQSSLVIIRDAGGYALPTFELIDSLQGTSTEPTAAVQQGAGEFIPQISLLDVTFRYPDADMNALNHINLEIEPQSFIAIVGPSGAGKSTLADLILGIYSPTSGQVLVSGISPRDAIETWPGRLAYVPQSNAIFEGTVRDNVALGLPVSEVDDAKVWYALKTSHLADVFSQRQGLDTVMGEQGIQLSGGQRQRLGIARALYMRPRLIILDEPTSALDAETENLLAVGLRSLTEEATVVVIAHRLSTVRRADKVIYLEGGSILHDGTFDQVRNHVRGFDRQTVLLGVDNDN